LTIKRKKERLSEARKADLEKTNRMLQFCPKVSELEKEVTSLEKDRDLKVPLIQPAADIRFRYLEYARETALGISRANIDRAVIMNDNIAAHRANGAEVEELVVKLEYMSDQIMERDRAKYFRHRPVFTPIC
jgi:hypothetical protein